MRVIFRRFDQREVIRNIGVQLRQLQRNLTGLLLPVGEGLGADFIHLIRGIDKVRRLVMRFVRADVPDAGILRRHHRQAGFYRPGIILVGNIYRVEGMFHRHADHGVRQPLHIIHVAGDGRVAEIEIQHVREFIKIALIDAFLTQ